MFNNLEKTIFSNLLESVSDDLCNNSCNDFCVAVTPHNKEELRGLIERMYQDDDEEHMEHMLAQLDRGVQVFFIDHDLVDYLKEKIAN